MALGRRGNEVKGIGAKGIRAKGVWVKGVGSVGERGHWAELPGFCSYVRWGLRLEANSPFDRASTSG